MANFRQAAAPKMIIKPQRKKSPGVVPLEEPQGRRDDRLKGRGIEVEVVTALDTVDLELGAQDLPPGLVVGRGGVDWPARATQEEKLRALRLMEE
jgi:hypothetical protein